MTWGEVLNFCSRHFWRKVDNIRLRSGQYITFGSGSEFDTYVEGTWTPAVDASTSPTVTYTTQEGYYTQIGNTVFYSLYIDIATYSGGSGNIFISLPLTATAHRTVATVSYSGVDLAATTTDVVFIPQASESYGFMIQAQDDGTTAGIDATALAAGDVLRISGFYFV